MGKDGIRKAKIIVQHLKNKITIKNQQHQQQLEKGKKHMVFCQTPLEKNKNQDTRIP